MQVPLRRRMPSPRRGRVTAIALALAGLALGCGDAHWLTLRWPSAQPDAPPQPTLTATELGLAAVATQIDYEPEAVSVALSLRNDGAGTVGIDRAGILLAWDELEYPPDPPDPGAPARIILGPGEVATVTLRYHLGRALTGSGAELLLRSLTRDGVAVVELPTLALPGKPL